MLIFVTWATTESVADAMRIDIILNAGFTAGQVSELCQLADRYDGIQTVWVSSFPGRRDPALTVAATAGDTRRVRLGTMPVSPYEVHPLRLADQLLTLNELTAGRAAILIGGLGRSVARLTGLEPSRRVTAVRDCVAILKGLSPDQPLNHEGSVYRLVEYQPEWATTEPAPLIYVGSTGPQMLRMAAGVADGVMMSDVPLTRMPEVMAPIQAGHPPVDFRINNFFAWHVKTDRDAAMAEARRELAWRGLLKTWYTSTFMDPQDAGFVEANWGAFMQAFLKRTDVIEGVPEAIVGKLVDNLTFAGGPQDIDRIADELHGFAAAGQNEVALKVHDQPEEAIRLIGERLVPAMQSRVSG